MIILPAIDLLQGRAVRLRQGNFDSVTDFGEPLGWLRRWSDEGAKAIHVVDLDGAREGRLAQLDLIRDLAQTPVRIQAGGGVRTVQDVESLVSAGVWRVVVGTSALQDLETLQEILQRFGDKIVVALDSRDNRVLTHGWAQSLDASPIDLSTELSRVGASRFAVTDVVRDGMLTEPNYDLLASVVRASGRPVIASGGVSTLDAVRRLREQGMEAAIIGRALYDGELDLRKAIEVADDG